MALFIATNSRLLASASFLYAQLQSNRVVRLFQNNVQVSPATTIADLFECDFNGYSPIDTIGKWKPPRLVHDGLYLIDLPILSFTATSGSTQQVFGAFIDHLGIVEFAVNFDPPVDLSTPTSFSIYLGLTEWALAVAPI